MDEKQLEICSCTDAGYQPLVYSNGWRVAFLNDTSRFHLENIHELQRHNTSDEIFILLNGSCTLFIGDGKESDPGEITEIKLEPLHLYNVKAGVWHTHVTIPGTTLAIVENADVSALNTDTIFIAPGSLGSRRKYK